MVKAVDRLPLVFHHKPQLQSLVLALLNFCAQIIRRKKLLIISVQFLYPSKHRISRPNAFTSSVKGKCGVLPRTKGTNYFRQHATFAEVMSSFYQCSDDKRRSNPYNKHCSFVVWHPTVVSTRVLSYILTPTSCRRHQTTAVFWLVYGLPAAAACCVCRIKFRRTVWASFTASALAENLCQKLVGLREDVRPMWRSCIISVHIFQCSECYR